MAKEYMQDIISSRIKPRIQLSMYTVTDKDMDIKIIPALRSEHRDWNKAGYFIPPDGFTRSDLRDILELSDPKDRSIKLRRYIESTWKINPMLIGIGFVRQGTDLFDVGHLPFELKELLYGGFIWSSPRKAKKLFEYARKFFISAARAITQIGMEGSLIPRPLLTPLGGGFNVSDYYGFQPSAREASVEKLWSRTQMDKWLYAVLMKTVLPTLRPTEHFELISSLLNMTAFFRALETVHEDGYPAQWLADVLLTLLANRVKTTARPARRALWLPELPFGLASPAPVPPLSQIRRYAIKFGNTIWRGDTWEWDSTKKTNTFRMDKGVLWARNEDDSLLVAATITFMLDVIAMALLTQMEMKNHMSVIFFRKMLKGTY
ncbi:hypothetical protein EJ02DRAFT_422234 [Clathrospora elynae]|uniref:Uncharacterized protein n=1 Tax=Clathrospora elynae TaxID=706981 RepID=A0A6A5SRH0_9PLEO|nr:hypothetical protein EJ02DRAFT_422234 [Clathrospora elynae]